MAWDTWNNFWRDLFEPARDGAAEEGSRMAREHLSIFDRVNKLAEENRARADEAPMPWQKCDACGIACYSHEPNICEQPSCPGALALHSKFLASQRRRVMRHTVIMPPGKVNVIPLELPVGSTILCVEDFHIESTSGAFRRLYVHVLQPQPEGDAPCTAESPDHFTVVEHRLWFVAIGEELPGVPMRFLSLFPTSIGQFYIFQELNDAPGV